MGKEVTPTSTKTNNRREEPRVENGSSNRSVVYISRLTPVKIFCAPAASKYFPLRNPTYVSKGTDHGLMSKLNIYTKTIYFKNDY